MTSMHRYLIESLQPVESQESVVHSVQAVEAYVSTLQPDERKDFFASLIDGRRLVEVHGEELGEQLAAERLVSLMGVIGETAERLAGIEVIISTDNYDYNSTTLTEMHSSLVKTTFDTDYHKR